VNDPKETCHFCAEGDFKQGHIWHCPLCHTAWEFRVYGGLGCWIKL
jgi:hypothetical protein